MPSISQAALDELEERAQSAEQNARTQVALVVASGEVAERNLRTALEALDAVQRVAKGLALEPRNPNGRGYAPFGDGYGSSLMATNHDPRLTPEEIEWERQRVTNERIVALEGRLAAVIAVASFVRAL